MLPTRSRGRCTLVCDEDTDTQGRDARRRRIGHGPQPWIAARPLSPRAKIAAKSIFRTIPRIRISRANGRAAAGR